MESYSLKNFQESPPYQVAQVIYQGSCQYCFYHDTAINRVVVHVHRIAPVTNGWYYYTDPDITFYDAVKMLGHEGDGLIVEDGGHVPAEFRNPAHYYATAVAELPLSIVTLIPAART